MRRFLLCVTLWAVLSAGCQVRSDLDTPPDTRYGEDVCDQCRMIINEARFAAAYVTRQGTVRRFDDIGDMLAYHAIHTEDVAVFWVHDYDTTAWLKADVAVFVVSRALHTPMGHGIVAIRTQTQGEELAARTHGTVTSFRALQTQSGHGHAVSMQQHHLADPLATPREHHTPPIPMRRNIP